jgi:signal transduction histidine kinase
MNSHPIARPITNRRNQLPPLNRFRSLATRSISQQTDLKRLNEIPKPVQKELAAFASALAHEVRNPLTTINLASEMLQSMDREEDQRIYLDMILRASGRIRNLINDLLHSCQGDTTLGETHSIQKLLDEVLELNEDRLLLKNITVIKDYSSADCKVWVNEQQIRIAFINIVVNAIEAMDLGSGVLKLVTRAVDGQCILEIEDNGIGIPKENMKKLFDPYFTNKLGGMGLGLSTTKDILLTNRVKLDVRSEEGRGTCFVLLFDRMP